MQRHRELTELGWRPRRARVRLERPCRCCGTIPCNFDRVDEDLLSDYELRGDDPTDRDVAGNRWDWYYDPDVDDRAQWEIDYAVESLRTARVKPLSANSSGRSTTRSVRPSWLPGSNG